MEVRRASRLRRSGRIATGWFVLMAGLAAGPGAAWAVPDESPRAVDVGVTAEYAEPPTWGPASITTATPRTVSSAPILFVRGAWGPAHRVIAPDGIAAFGTGSGLDLNHASASPAPPPSPIESVEEVPAEYAEPTYAGGDVGGYEPAVASESAPRDSSWSFGVDGYCADGWCAQEVVDSSSMAYIDYGNGFSEIAGHNTGAAGQFLGVQAGDTVDLGGYGSYTAGESVTVAPGTSADAVAPGFALQTCDEWGNLVLVYLH